MQQRSKEKELFRASGIWFKNPYYKDPNSDDDSNPAEQLPASAEATKPSSATATVTDHTKTDSNGNI